MFHGAYTALVTPFRGGSVDFDRLRQNVRFQVEQGIDGLVPVGTTGESPTLSHEEHRKVIDAVVQEVRSLKAPVKVIAGTGSNATAEALELTVHARKVGADGALMVNPYYNKPTQEGLYRHFATIADAVDIPILLYNIPGRTGVTMAPATIARLAQGHPQVVGVKEATGSMDIASEIAMLCGPKFDIISGDDSLTLPLMALGGRGVISVLSNLVPARIKALTAAALSGKWDEARSLHLSLFPLGRAMFLETNPIPVKYAMKALGRDTGELRLPLCEPTDATKAAVEAALRDAGLQ